MATGGAAGARLPNPARPDAPAAPSDRIRAGVIGYSAYRIGEKVIWDAENERITNHVKANEMLVRRYRVPWKLV